MIRFKAFLKKGVIFLCFSYSFLLIIWFILRWLMFDQFWPLAIINTTIFYFFLPLPILMLFTIMQRLKWSFIVLIFPLGIFVYFWGSLFLPPIDFANNRTERKQLSAMSFNVLFSNQTPESLAASIESASPDIVGLQELAPHIVDSLKANTTDEYPYHTFDLFEPKGVGLLSRYPIISATKFYFPPRDDLALHTVIDVDGQLIHVFVVHFSANNFFDNPVSQLPGLATERYTHRANQIASLRKELKTVENPVILMCDCNFTDTSEVYFRLNQVLNDSYRSAGWGFGHTLHSGGLPFRVQRIDYVWHSDDFKTSTSYVVGQTGGSDHHPVISTLEYDGKD